MMLGHKGGRRWGLVCGVGILLLAMAAAPAAAASDVAELGGGGANLEWRPLVEHGAMTLTVTGPGGFALTREFAASQNPSLSLFDAAGQALADGDYNWQLSLAPRLEPQVRRRLASARRSGDDASLQALRETGKLADGAVASGTFRVQQGAFVMPEERAERPAGQGPRTTTANGVRNVTAADQVIPDDLIVQGSTCVGLDCVNNESFGFDTIRLKENNTRIKFEDTSSTAGFPTNDWQLTANDSASGGSSKFSIEDITGSKVPFTITAGAATNSMFVDSTGRVGFRTSTPVLDLHVNTSNTPALRLEQNNSGGFTAQTWDIAGNEANFFVRDVTGGSKLSFRIRPGAPTSSIDISADGDVGIGTASPSSSLHVSRSNGTANLRVSETNGTEAARSLLSLQNNGATLAAFIDSNASNTAGDWQIGRNAADQFVIRATTGATGDEIAIDPDGDLRVTGSFISNGTTLNVPDFVFEPDYPLMTLPELARFVEDNRHLPNVPSAKEIGANGLDITQMQLRLLEKIEELTLYTLQQESTIRALEARLEAMESEAVVPD